MVVRAILSMKPPWWRQCAMVVWRYRQPSLSGGAVVQCPSGRSVAAASGDSQRGLVIPIGLFELVSRPTRESGV